MKSEEKSGLCTSTSARVTCSNPNKTIYSYMTHGDTYTKKTFLERESQHSGRESPG